MNVQQEKAKIQQQMTKRATTTRVRQILNNQGIGLERWELWEWFRGKTRLAEYDAEIIAAYWQAIGERTEKFRKLAVPQKQKAIASAKRLAAEAA